MGEVSYKPESSTLETKLPSLEDVVEDPPSGERLTQMMLHVTILIFLTSNYRDSGKRSKHFRHWLRQPTGGWESHSHSTLTIRG